MTALSDAILSWHNEHGRKDLPWQSDKTPYRVWVSEIMLQQTQVATVIPYYLKFMDAFPSVHDLATAEQDRVLSHWAGLGYYSRARNLHRSAQIVCKEHDGHFPETLDGLCELPGIGKSTAGAILSIAMQKRGVILDGNVKRVWARYYGIREWTGERLILEKLWGIAEDVTPDVRVDQYSQAIMDLGATLCSRKNPNCVACPIQVGCQAYEADLTKQIPASKPRKAQITKARILIHCEDSQGKILLEKRPSSGIWGGLYSFPEMDETSSEDDIKAFCKTHLKTQPQSISAHALIKHTFTHFKLEAKVVKMKLTKNINSGFDESAYEWISIDALDAIGLPAPVEKYLKSEYSDNDQLSLKVETALN